MFELSVEFAALSLAFSSARSYYVETGSMDEERKERSRSEEEEYVSISFR